VIENFVCILLKKYQWRLHPQRNPHPGLKACTLNSTVEGGTMRQFCVHSQRPNLMKTGTNEWRKCWGNFLFIINKVSAGSALQMTIHLMPKRPLTPWKQSRPMEHTIYKDYTALMHLFDTYKSINRCLKCSAAGNKAYNNNGKPFASQSTILWSHTAGLFIQVFVLLLFFLWKLTADCEMLVMRRRK
jgi:hypothetical protein